MVDFKKALKNKSVSTQVNPLKIYETLDRKSVAGPLREAQETILSNWYKSNRDNRDSIIKLHTGEGKTLIGLLILQSLINSKEGPCLYICPNIQLVEQVKEEAQKFGISYCDIDSDNELPREYLTGEKVLITHSQKVFNGLTKFNSRNLGHNYGTILLDDSHSSVETIKNAYSITIQRHQNQSLYNSFLELFKEDLNEQGEGSLLDIINNQSSSLMHVPYWSWSNKKSTVLELLHKNKDVINDIKFTWPIIKDDIENYGCYITNNKIEISPYSINIKKFPIFFKASKRILMSATTQDDSFFIKVFDFKEETLLNPLTSPQSKWSGEKMVIIPSEISDRFDRDYIVTNFAPLKTNTYGVVALVPSTERAHHYKNLGATVTNSENIVGETNKLKNKNFTNVIVINNRYDGIDLPDESCRILILDTLPISGSLSEKYEEQARETSLIVNKKIAQKIEQGLGRAVRGEKDYCVILIIGPDLVRFVQNPQTQSLFSPQTIKQFKITGEITELAKDDLQKDKEAKVISSSIQQSLERDEGWKEYYRDKMNSLEDNNTEENQFYKSLSQERDIEKLYFDGEYQKAIKKLEKYINTFLDVDPIELAWYKQQLARYYFQIDLNISNKIQKAAFKDNNELLKPIDNISYEKLSFINENRVNLIKTELLNYSNYESLKLHSDELLQNLGFGVNSNKFELSLMKIGQLLGFNSQRPDKSFNKGPDNLWCVSKDKYLFFECKNQVKESRKDISKDEAGQMNNHCGWFDEEYGVNTDVTRIMIIPTKDLSNQANFTHDVKIMTSIKLSKLKTNIKKFIQSLHTYELSEIDNDTISTLLELNRLTVKHLEKEYVDEYYHQV